MQQSQTQVQLPQDIDTRMTSMTIKMNHDTQNIVHEVDQDGLTANDYLSRTQTTPIEKKEQKTTHKKKSVPMHKKEKNSTSKNSKQ